MLRLSQMVLWESAAASSGGHAASPPAVTPEQYATALLSAATTSNLALAASTGKQRWQCWSEFEAWMSSLHDALQRGPLAATPADIVAYCEQHWTVQHGETLLDDGTVRAAPSSLESLLSQLSGVFELQGRAGSWDLHPEVRGWLLSVVSRLGTYCGVLGRTGGWATKPDTALVDRIWEQAREYCFLTKSLMCWLQGGNPVNSHLVHSYKDGYAAKLDSLEKLLQLLNLVEAEQHAAAPQVRKIYESRAVRTEVASAVVAADRSLSAIGQP